jgi:hypothetical protein
MAVSQSATITAANTFTTPIQIIGWYNVSISRPSGVVGTLGGTTATVQRSFDKGVTWLDLKQWIVTAEEYGFEPEGSLIRVGVKTAQYVLSVNVRIGHEGGMTK